MYLRALESEARLARPSSQRKTAFERSPLEVRMFNVGHGEAILLVFPDERAWLIDGGSSNSPGVNATLGQRLIDYVEARDLVLEAFVPSHPHMDHVGAAATILASDSAPISDPLTIYRSDELAWELDRVWLNELWDAVDGLGNQVEDVALRDAHREVAIAEGISAHAFAALAKTAVTRIQSPSP
jgi:glyoxylase-like metal-dependent hydrolase (beta-lactamase superfamily II)